MLFDLTLFKPRGMAPQPPRSKMHEDAAAKTAAGGQ
ncbi:MAG: hypothetical protein RLZZ598_1585 [Pseudomonadota bacterium]|jgi:hypothetical protein